MCFHTCSNGSNKRDHHTTTYWRLSGGKGTLVWLANPLFLERETLGVQMSFRLSGNSNIEIAAEIVGGTRVVPKVTDLHVSGVARVILSPLLPEVPGFGAMVFSLK